jgi:hypothetical protein
MKTALLVLREIHATSDRLLLHHISHTSIPAIHFIADGDDDTTMLTRNDIVTA